MSEEFVEIDLDDQGMVMPAKTGKIALIDADTVAYTACLNTEVAGDILPQDMYTEMEWDAIITNKQYDEELEALWECDVEIATSKAMNKIQRILDKTGCIDYELHFSGGRDNFRYDVFPEYKANRAGTRTPAGLSDVKKALCETGKGTIHETFEADDIVVYKAIKEPEKYLLAAMDKDVIKSVAGTHFNYYERAESTNKYGNTLKAIDMTFVETDAYTAMTWRYIQTLTGDKTDGIIGLHRIGEKTALKLIDGLMTHKDLWKVVVDNYKMKGRTKEEALVNLNLVDMKLLQDDGTIKLNKMNEKGELI